MVLTGASLAALIFALRNAPIAPYWQDEWMYVPLVSGEQKFSLAWLVAFHNEHRIPLPKLIWFVMERLSGMDSRWGVGINVMVLTLAAALLLWAMAKFRGQPLWTDAVIALIFLHWGHWENLTWPFQISFVLETLCLSIAVSAILRMTGDRAGEPSVALGAGLAVMPLCGGATLPYVALLGPWCIWLVVRRPPQSGRARSALLPAIGLLLGALSLVGFRRPSFNSPSPGLGATLSVAVECLAGSLGPQASLWWPISGGIAVIALGLASAGLVIAGWRYPSSRRCAQGLILVLGGLVVLVGVIGHSRGGDSSTAGFTSRYVALTCIFPVLIYATLDLGRPSPIKRAGRLVLFSVVAALYLPNAVRACDRLADRAHAALQLGRDVHAGMPLKLIALEHGFWCPRSLSDFRRGLESLARARLSIYSREEPPRLPGSRKPDAEGTIVTPLRDGRIALELLPRSKYHLPLKPGIHVVRMTWGSVGSLTGDIQARLRLAREDGSFEPVGSDLLRPPGRERRAEFRIQTRAPAVLEMVTEGDPVGTPEHLEPELVMLLEDLPGE